MKSMIRSLILLLVLAWSSVHADTVDLTLNLYSGNPVLSPVAGSPYEAQRVSGPAVIYANGTYYMYYNGQTYANGPNHEQVGLATSSDGLYWTRHPDSPVLLYGLQPWCFWRIMPASIFYENGSFRLYINGNEKNLYGTAKGGCAFSDDGTNWTLYDENPLFSETTHINIMEIVRFQNKYWAYVYHNGIQYYSTSDDGLSFSDRYPVHGFQGSVRCAVSHNFEGGEFIFAIIWPEGAEGNYYAISLDGIHFRMHQTPIKNIPENSSMGIETIIIEDNLMKCWGHWGLPNADMEITYGTIEEPDWSLILCDAIIKPYEFVPGTPAKASEVNQNFDVLYDKVNQNSCEISRLKSQIQTIQEIICREHPTSSICE